MRASVAGENAAVNGVTAIIAKKSIHTADPGTSGTSKVTGGTYADQTVAYASASAGSAANSAGLSFNIPASTTCAYEGNWETDDTTYVIGAPLSASITFTGAGTLTIATGAATLSAS